jgi:hypothetical protein
MGEMGGSQAVEEEQAWKRWLTPWKIAAVLLGLFLLSEGYLAWRDHALVTALENAPAFAHPALELEFPKTIQYDPLSFVGRGAHAGFWTWTPNGLDLTPEGEKYFRMDGDRIVSQLPAGARRPTRIRERKQQGEARQIEFFYEWSDLSPVAEALLRPAPRKGEEYLASAVLAPDGGGWKITALETRDFDEPLSRLQDSAAGILR